MTSVHEHRLFPVGVFPVVCFSSSACPQTDAAQLYNTHPDSCTHTDRTGLDFFCLCENKNSSHCHFDNIHIGLMGHSGEITGKSYVRLFPQFEFLCFVGILANGFGVWCSGIYGLVGLGILDLPPTMCHEVLNVGGWLTHGDLALDAQVDFLAVVELVLFLLGFVVNGRGLMQRVMHRSGLLPVSILPMLVMLELG